MNEIEIGALIGFALCVAWTIGYYFGMRAQKRYDGGTGMHSLLDRLESMGGDSRLISKARNQPLFSPYDPLLVEIAYRIARAQSYE